MTETSYLIQESALYSCVEIIRRTTISSKGLGALIPPSSSNRDETILSIPFCSALVPFATLAFRNKAAAVKFAETLLPIIKENNSLK